MDPNRFDALHRAFLQTPSRRGALRVLSGIGLLGLFGRDNAEARRKKKRKKKQGASPPPPPRTPRRLRRHQTHPAWLIARGRRVLVMAAAAPAPAIRRRPAWPGSASAREAFRPAARTAAVAIGTARSVVVRPVSDVTGSVTHAISPPTAVRPSRARTR